MIKFRAAALSDIGKVRRENEDRVLFDEKIRVFGIADGVGGLPGGAKAAQRAADEVTAALRAASPTELPDLNAIVRKANEAVISLGRRVSPMMGIGTTLTFGHIQDGCLRIAHVGDSRCYGWRVGEFQCLTEDHSVENGARLRRARGEVVYYNEEHRNVLTRCIGQSVPPEADLIVRELKAGDRYLFSTDGVSRTLLDQELRDLMGAEGDAADLVRGPVAMALQRGGPDNATGVLLIIDEV